MLEASQYDCSKSFLQDCVKGLRKASPNLSDSQIAKKLSISSSTFGRIANAEVKTSFNNALSISRRVCGDEKVQDFIKKFYPEMKKTFEKVYSGNAHKAFVKNDIEEYLQDSNTHELVMMAMTNAGVSRDQVQSEFGHRGLRTLETLIEAGLIDEVAPSVYKCDGANFGQDTVQKLVQNITQSNYELAAFGKKDNWLSVQWESVDADYIGPKLVDICRKANQEVRALFSDPKSAGKDVMWFTLGMDSLNTTTTINGTEGVIQ